MGHLVLRYVSRIVVVGFLLTSAVSGVPQERKVPEYPDTEEGLQQFLIDLTKAIQQRNKGLASHLSKQVVIPHYKNWFQAVFVEDEAVRITGAYGDFRKKLPELIRGRLSNMGRESIPVFSARRFTAGSVPENEKWVKAAMMAMRQPLPVYEAQYQLSSAKEPFSFGYFIFVNGAFRFFESTIFSVLSTAPPMRIRIGGNVQGARLIERPPLVYPPEAIERRIQGTVHMQAIVGRDGRILKLEVLSGDPILAPAAVEAVRRWRYQPTLLNGVPVEVVTTIDVIFTLSR